MITRLKNGTLTAADVDPILIFTLENGTKVSLDNRRLYAFRVADKPIATINGNLDEILTQELANRYKLDGKPIPVTYRDALNLRIGNQKPKATWSIENPSGSYNLPIVK